MKFNTESELVGALKFSLINSFPHKNMSIVEEVSVGNGIADLVVTISNDDFLFCQKHHELLNLRDVNIYCLITKNSGLSILQISEITRISVNMVRKSLLRLEKRSYVLNNDGCYITSKNYEMTYKLSYAIEAKLKDWKRALKQAYRYRWFAEHSYVVMDEFNAVPAINNIDLFKKYNVGLASINIQGQLKRIYNPTKEEPFDVKLQMLLSEKVLDSLSVH